MRSSTTRSITGNSHAGDQLHVVPVIDDDGPPARDGVRKAHMADIGNSERRR